MKKPICAPNFMGEIMMDCWKKEPKDRPSFRQLEKIITSNMESSVTSYYLCLNAPYEKFNDEKTFASKEERFGLAKLLNDKSQQTKSLSQPEGYVVRYTKPPQRRCTNSKKKIEWQLFGR